MFWNIVSTFWAYTRAKLESYTAMEHDFGFLEHDLYKLKKRSLKDISEKLKIPLAVTQCYRNQKSFALCLEKGISISNPFSFCPFYV